MFGNVFKEGYENKAKQDALDTYRASLAYQVARRDNPKMLEPTTVDFSNPQSVAQMQYQIANPYGYNNPYANPNLVAQNAGYNPMQYAAPTYGYGGGTWYGNSWGYGYGYNDNSKYMIPPGKDNVEVGPGDRPPIKKKSLEQKLKDPVHVEIVRGKEVEESRTPTPSPKVEIIKTEVHHEPHQPYSREELDPDYNQLKTIPDTPLNWTAQDEQELDKLSDDLAIYDKAMAHVAYNVPTLVGLTREDYDYIKRYFRDRLQDFKTKEMLNRQFDYRAKYRYRRLPPVIKEDGHLNPDKGKPVPIPIKSINLSGDVVYDYDRGRDELTQEEWDLFVDRAYVDMMDGATKLKVQDLINLNKHSVENKPQQQETEKYNPFDPIAVKLHNMKMAQKSYQTNREFYHHVFRNKLTDQEFDNWWYGLDTSNPAQIQGNNRGYDQAAAQEVWAKQMTLRNINNLMHFKPVDPVAMQNWFNQTANKAIDYYTNGTVKRDMSLADFFKNLAYLDTRIHELNLIEQRRQQNQQMWNDMSKNTYRSSLYSYMNPSGYRYNPNPYYSPQWGTIDPRLGNPQQVVDITNNPMAQEKKARFMQHCATTQGSVPLSPVYK